MALKNFVDFRTPVIDAAWLNAVDVMKETTVPAIQAVLVSVKDYGATGDGTTDETQFFQDAIDALETLGGGTLYVPAGRYVIRSQILITGNNISIRGDGASSVLDLTSLEYFTSFSSLDIDFDSATYYRKAAFALRGTLVKEVYLDTTQMPVLANDAVIPLVAGGTADIAVGDSIFLRSRQHWYGIGERYAVSRVIDIDSGADTVTLMEGVPHQFDSTGTVRTWNVSADPAYAEWGGYYSWPTAASNARLVVWRPVRNFSMADLAVEGGGLAWTAVGHGPGLDGVSEQTITSASTIVNGAGKCLLHFQYAEGIRISRVSITEGLRGVPFYGMYSSNVTMSDCYFRGLADDSFEITENVNSGFYSMYFSQGRNYVVTGCTFDRVRHGPDGAELFNFLQTSNTAYRTFRAAFGSHQEVYQLIVSGNAAYNCYSFAVLRAKDAVVTNNTVVASVSSAQPTWGSAALSGTIQTRDDDDPGSFVITGNSFLINASVPAGPIVLDMALGLCNVSNNIISVRAGTAIYIQSARLCNTMISNNNIKFTNVDEPDYTGDTAYVNPTNGIIVWPREEPADYAAYLGTQVLTSVVNGVAIKDNIIENYGGTTTFPGAGHGIVLSGPTVSANAMRNIVISGNIGKPVEDDASFFIRFFPGGYYGEGIIVVNNTTYGDATAVVGYAAADEHLFFEAPVMYGNTSETAASKTHLVVGEYDSLGDGTTLLKGTLLNNSQAGVGDVYQYIVVTSGTTGSLAGGITAVTTNGSPTVTLTGNSVGDSYVVPGSYISIAGAFTGVRVLAVSANYATLTMASNATGSVSGVAVSRYNPVYGKVSTVAAA